MNFEEMYPKEREQEIEQHLRKVWSAQVRGTYSCILPPTYRQEEDTEVFVELAVKHILENLGQPGYNPPRLLTDFGTVSTASYWGGNVHTPVGGFKFIDPIIHTGEETAGVFPKSPEEGEAGKALKLYQEVCGKLGADRLYVSTIDFQGPLNTAALLWEQSDFMMAMLETPDVVHAFLDKVTDQLIQIMKYMIRETKGRVCSNVWPYIWLPSDLGIGMTEDYMPLLSAEMYREFGIPYVERISREFGGVFLHCCGEYEHQIENLRRSEINLLGLEFHYPHTRPEVLFEAFGGDVLFVPFLAPKGVDIFGSKVEYLNYIKKVKQMNTRLWFILDPLEEGFEQQLALVKEMTA